MRRRQLTGALALLALLGLLAAACGGGDEALSKDEYQQQLSDAGQSLTQSTANLGEDVSAAVQGQAAAGDKAAEDIESFQAKLRDTADELEDLNPPEDAAAAHDRLVTALRDYADDLDELHDALGEGDASQIVAKMQALASLDSVKAVEQAGTDLKEQGYEFEDGSGDG